MFGRRSTGTRRASGSAAATRRATGRTGRDRKPTESPNGAKDNSQGRKPLVTKSRANEPQRGGRNVAPASRRSHSIPEILLVKLHLMLSQQLSHLVLERAFCVMRLLILDVSRDRTAIGEL